MYIIKVRINEAVLRREAEDCDPDFHDSTIEDLIEGEFGWLQNSGMEFVEVSRIVAAGNKPEDGAAATGLPEALTKGFKVENLMSLAIKEQVDKYCLWGEHPSNPRADWQHEVGNGDTNLGYWEWVVHRESEDGNETATTGR